MFFGFTCPLKFTLDSSIPKYCEALKTSESKCNGILSVFPMIHGFLPQIHGNQKLVLYGEQLVLDSFHCTIFVLIVMFCLL